jgi:hypothetical protein
MITCGKMVTAISEMLGNEQNDKGAVISADAPLTKALFKGVDQKTRTTREYAAIVPEGARVLKMHSDSAGIDITFPEVYVDRNNRQVRYLMPVDPSATIEKTSLGRFRQDVVQPRAEALDKEDRELAGLLRKFYSHSGTNMLDSGGIAVMSINAPYISEETGNDRLKDVIHEVSIIGRQVCSEFVNQGLFRGAIIGSIVALQRA